MAIRHYLTDGGGIHVINGGQETVVLCDECGDFPPFITPSESYAIEIADEHYNTVHKPEIRVSTVRAEMVLGHEELAKDITRLTQEMREIQTTLTHISKIVSALETRIRVLEQ